MPEQGAKDFELRLLRSGTNRQFTIILIVVVVVVVVVVAAAVAAVVAAAVAVVVAAVIGGGRSPKLKILSPKLQILKPEPQILNLKTLSPKPFQAGAHHPEKARTETFFKPALPKMRVS